MMRAKRARGLALGVVLALAFSACSGSDPPDRAPTGLAPVVVASFGFSESVTLAEIYAQALVSSGIAVERATDLGSREVVEPALEQGKIDFVPEYLGTALAFLEPGTSSEGRPATYERARQAFAARGSALLAPSLAQDQNGIVVSRASAARWGLSKVSDLQPLAPNLVFGGPPECPERPLCLPGLERVYGLRFKEFRALDVGGPLSVGALEGDEVDVVLLFTTDGHLSGGQFVLLEDDRSLQPPENVVPVLRKEVLDRYGTRLSTAVDRVSAALTTPELIQLNRRVAIDGVKPVQAAVDWLRAHGLG